MSLGKNIYDIADEFQQIGVRAFGARKFERQNERQIYFLVGVVLNFAVIGFTEAFGEYVYRASREYYGRVDSGAHTEVVGLFRCGIVENKVEGYTVFFGPTDSAVTHFNVNFIVRSLFAVSIIEFHTVSEGRLRNGISRSDVGAVVNAYVRGIVV